jgi:hypothetical protein
MSTDPITDLRSLCIRKELFVRIPIPIWTLLFWLDGFVVGACVALLLRR